MSVKLKTDDPIIAIMGPESTVRLGPFQFHEIRKIPNGNGNTVLSDICAISSKLN